MNDNIDFFDDVELYCMTLNHFTIIKEIGTGSIGKVYMAKYNKTDHIYALKFIGTNHSNNVLEELKLSKEFSHPNLMKTYGYFLENCDNNLYIIAILEYINGMDLHDIYSRKSNLYILTILPSVISQVISGLKYIHSFGIIHRDIKLENIIIDTDGVAKIVDYDFITKSPNNECCGTPYYISPEVINGAVPDHKSDIWALGVLIYTILVGDYPFDGNSDQDLYDSIAIDRLTDYKIPKIYRSLVKQLLEKDPSKRIELSDALVVIKGL